MAAESAFMVVGLRSLFKRIWDPRMDLHFLANALMKALHADVAKLVDARDLKSLGAICAGSIPAVRTKIIEHIDPFCSISRC